MALPNTEKSAQLLPAHEEDLPSYTHWRKGFQTPPAGVAPEHDHEEWSRDIVYCGRAQRHYQRVSRDSTSTRRQPASTETEWEVDTEKYNIKNTNLPSSTLRSIVTNHSCGRYLNSRLMNCWMGSKTVVCWVRWLRSELQNVEGSKVRGIGDSSGIAAVDTGNKTCRGEWNRGIRYSYSLIEIRAEHLQPWCTWPNAARVL